MLVRAKQHAELPTCDCYPVSMPSADRYRFLRYVIARASKDISCLCVVLVSFDMFRPAQVATLGGRF